MKTTEPRIRVLHIITSLVFGGAERLVVSAATHLPPSGFESVICCLAGRGPLAAEAAREGIRVESLDAFPGFRHPGAFVRLYRLIRAVRPNIVHTHLQAASLYGRLAAWLARVPAIVATEHNIYATKPRRYVQVERLLAPRTAALVAVSEQVRRFLAAQLKIAPSAIRVIPNGVARPVASAAGVQALRRRVSIPDGHVVLGTVASLTPKKGHAFLLRALTILLQKNAMCSLILAGDGPERPGLEAMADALGVSSSVSFIGTVDCPADLLALIDVFVLPSLVEGLPLALLEAMLAGKPVVATTVGGVPEVVRSNVNGVLVPPGDADALASALERLIAAPAERGRLGAQARASIEREFTEERYLEALSSLYTEVTKLRLKPTSSGG